MALADKIIDACGRIRSRDDAIAVVNAAIEAERERCAAIIQAARMGTIDGDLRSLIHRIKSGAPVPTDDEDAA